METFESLVKVMHGATTLVSIGDPMWELPALNGRQVVQSAQFVRAAGIKAFPRGNQSNELTFSLCNEQTTIEAAMKAQFQFPVTAPKTMADVTVTFADGSGVKIKNAAVESWSGGQTERLGRHTLRIIGGELESIPAATP